GGVLGVRAPRAWARWLEPAVGADADPVDACASELDEALRRERRDPRVEPVRARVEALRERAVEHGRRPVLEVRERGADLVQLGERRAGREWVGTRNGSGSVVVDGFGERPGGGGLVAARDEGAQAVPRPCRRRA